MAHVLRLANAGATVVQNLNRVASTDPHLMHYVPVSPTLTPTEYSEVLRNGGETLATTRRNVTESAVIRLESASVTAMQTIVQAIENIFIKAEEWQRSGRGEPYYIQFTPDGYTGANELWRSEILNGRLELGQESIDLYWGQKKVEVLVTWTRRFFWEAATAVALSISNTGDNVTPVVVTNNPINAGGSYNYVKLDTPGSTVLGSIPAPALMTIRKTTAVTSRPGSFYIGANVWAPSGEPGDFTPLLQGESAVTGVSTASGTSSGGFYMAVTVPVDEAEITRWALDGTSQVKQGGGRFFRVLARFSNTAVPIVPTLGLRLKLALGTSDIVWTGPEVLITTDRTLKDLGVIQLPPANLPFYESSTTYGTYSLLLFGRSLTGSTKSLGIDYLQLTPLDSYRVFEAAAFGLDQNRMIVDDPARNMVYQEAIAGGSLSNVFNVSGSPIWLWPGRAFRLHFLWSLIDGTAPITDAVEIGVSYRPRRLTI